MLLPSDDCNRLVHEILLGFSHHAVWWLAPRCAMLRSMLEAGGGEGRE